MTSVVSTFYAVTAGREPGLYTTWSSVEAQINGFVGSKWRPFASLFEAQMYISAAVIDEQLAIAPDMKRNISAEGNVIIGSLDAEARTVTQQVFYAVRVGRECGVYVTQASCEAQTIDYDQAQWQQFSTLHEAQLYLEAIQHPDSELPHADHVSAVASEETFASTLIQA